MSEKTPLQIYRVSSIGQALVDTLEDFVEKNYITNDLAHKILHQFDVVRFSSLHLAREA